jgi:general secretion pathway protein D
LRTVLLSSLIFLGVTARAAEDIQFQFKNVEVDVVIAAYSKATQQKFIVDPNVRGKITLITPNKVAIEEAFHLMSTALAINGYAILKEGDLMIVRSARNAQRSFVDVKTELPELRPERMATWVYKFKNIRSESVNRDLRILTSKDGELSVHADTNSVIICDWTSNLQRVAKIFEQIDVKTK